MYDDAAVASTDDEPNRCSDGRPAGSDVDVVAAAGDGGKAGQRE